MCERRAFVASCPVAATQRAVTRSLCRRGLLRLTGREQCDCVIQWAPFSKIAWTPVIEGERGSGPSVAFQCNCWRL
jgi:hypothetical protein